jgi:hypothetical protein
MVKSYEIHDNGGRPFRVDIQGMKVSVYKTEEDEVEKHLFDVTADEIFVGKKSPKGGYDGLKPKEAEGNSLLVLVGSKYIYIGSEIYQFQPVKGDMIEKFYSDIGNSDVPYPYAVGKTHIYILLDKIAVEKSFFDMKSNIYQQYYEAISYLPMCLKGHQDTSLCKDKKAARERIAEAEEKSKKLRVKVLQKRIY